MNNNPYAKGLEQYKAQSVNMMTQGEMLILLYDELIKRLKKAEILMKNEDFTASEKEVSRCQDIIAYLSHSLDRKYPVSGNLAQMYEYFTYEMIRLKAGRKLEVIHEVIPLVEELRDAFQQADRLSKKEREQSK